MCFTPEIIEERGEYGGEGGENEDYNGNGARLKYQHRII